MISQWGGEAAQMVAAVGPAVGTCCYPTGEDVVEQLLLTLSAPLQPNSEKNQMAGLVKHLEPAGQPRPDLKAINAMQLLLAGVPEVDVCSFCTSCRPDLFYSHRQSGGKTGRQGAIAMINTL